MIDSLALWLGLMLLMYAALSLFWAREAAVANRNVETWFSAGHALPPWMAALVGAGACVSAWFLLGSADAVARHGFSAIAWLQAGVILAIPGVLFFKRAWFVCQRYRISSLAELLRLYYRSEFLVVSCAVIAVLFALAFSGMQLRILSDIASIMSGGLLSPLLCAALLTVILFAYIVIGGMRAVGYFGMLQSVGLVSAALTLGVAILLGAGGPMAMTQSLAEATVGAESHWFSVAGVVQFVPGLGRGGFHTHSGTAALVLSSAGAILGLGCSPALFKLVFSTRSATGIAAGQTWVLAAFFGGLIMLFGGIVGSAGIMRGGDVAVVLETVMLDVSPWFSAWMLFGLIAGMQLFAGLALLVAAETLVRHCFKRWFYSDLSRRGTVNLTRVVVVVLAVIALLMTFMTPAAVSALGAMALPLSAQLVGPLAGILWFRWITPPAAVVGFGFGVAAVFLTDAVGIYILSYLGLELPWGRYPWTIHSAGWGLFCNAVAIGVVSTVSRHRALPGASQAIRDFIQQYFSARTPRWLNSLAWSIVLVWGFLAIGPGTLFGNFAFVGAEGQWILSVPSLWAWSVLFWLLGLVLVWFLSFRMGLASPEIPAIEPLPSRPAIRHDRAGAERERLRRVVLGGVIAAAVVIFLVWSFGG